MQRTFEFFPYKRAAGRYHGKSRDAFLFVEFTRVDDFFFRKKRITCAIRAMMSRLRAILAVF